MRMILWVTKISILEGKNPAAIARLKRMSADILPQSENGPSSLWSAIFKVEHLWAGINLRS